MPFTLAQPLGHQVTTADAKKRAVGLGRDRLGQVALARARRSIQQNAFPRLPLASKEVGELDRQDDGLFQGLLGLLQPGDVFPPHIGLVGENSPSQSSTQFLRVGVQAVVVVFSAGD